jgi:N,N'-diacetyllegionaminate synthase
MKDLVPEEQMKTVRGVFGGRKLVFVAEIGINHNGDVETARRMIAEAARAGADAVKFQTFVPEQMYSVFASSLLRYGDEREPDDSQIRMFRRFALGREDHRLLKNEAERLGLVFFSTAFDIESVDLLEGLGVALHKVASSEVTNHELLRRMARTGKPVLMSTGISTEREIEMAVELLKKGGCPDLELMHCVSLYPVRPEHANLSRIAALGKRFGLPVGFSDHSRHGEPAMVAAALGARLFEKHFMLDGQSDCPDSAVSLSPDEFAGMKHAVENALTMLGHGGLSYDFSEKEVANSARRSLFSGKFIPKGKALEPGDVVPKRPGVGLPAYRFEEIAGKRARVDIGPDRLLRPEYFE